MNTQQTVIPASEISPVRVLRMAQTPRDPYVFTVQGIRRLDRAEEGQLAGAVKEATPSATGPARSLNIYELVNCTV